MTSGWVRWMRVAGGMAAGIALVVPMLLAQRNTVEGITEQLPTATQSYIVQGESLDMLVEAVLQTGGAITHELRIIESTAVNVWVDQE